MSRKRTLLDKGLSIRSKRKSSRRGLVAMVGGKKDKRGRGMGGALGRFDMGFDNRKHPRRGIIGVMLSNARDRLSRTEYLEIKRAAEDAIKDDPRLAQVEADHGVTNQETFFKRLVRAIRDRVALIVKGGA